MLWLKGGLPIKKWAEAKDFFTLNAIKVSPHLVKKYKEKGNMTYLNDKLDPYVSDYYKNMQVESVDGLLDDLLR